MYKALVRSQVEYASVIWNPIYDKSSQQLGQIQRKFLKSVLFKSFKSKSSYASRLSKFCNPSLHFRRTLLDLTLLYNILYNKFDCNEISNQIYTRIPSSSKHIREFYTRQLFYPKPSGTKAGDRAPLNRTMASYNKNNVSKFNHIDIFGITFSQFFFWIVECCWLYRPLQRHRWKGL